LKVLQADIFFEVAFCAAQWVVLSRQHQQYLSLLQQMAVVGA
jgi:hypothetical protein